MGISGLRIKMGEVGVKLEGTVQPVNPSRKQPPSPLGTQDSFCRASQTLVPMHFTEKLHFPLSIILCLPPCQSSFPTGLGNSHHLMTWINAFARSALGDYALRMVQIVHEIFAKQWHTEIIRQSAWTMWFQGETRCKPALLKGACAAVADLQCSLGMQQLIPTSWHTMQDFPFAIPFSPPFPYISSFFHAFLPSFHKSPRSDQFELQCKCIQAREKDLIQTVPSRIPITSYALDHPKMVTDEEKWHEKKKILGFFFI